MSLYKRGEFWHYDFTINEIRHRGSTKLRSKTAARKVEDRQRERAALGATDRPLTIEQLSARWFVARFADKKSAKTTAQRLEIMLRLIGPNTLAEAIDTPDIEDAIQRRRLETTRHGRPPSNATVNRDLIGSTLRPILAYARRALKLPIHEIEWKELGMKEPAERTRTFTDAEIDAWRGALPPWHRPLFDFFARYGPRLSEAFFPPSAFDPAGRVTLRERKGGDDHTIPLLPEDAREMAARAGRAVAAGLSTVWFREMPNGELRALTPVAFASASERALKRLGMAGVRPVHDLRHHAATRLLRGSGSLKDTQRLLGHATIASTARYAHADDEDILRALRHASGTVGRHPPDEPLQDKGYASKHGGF